jgi:UDP-N-acetylmuramoylalanine--D-glutamate ligase
MKKVLVLGLGKSGFYVTSFLLKQNIEVIGYDDNLKKIDNLKSLKEACLIDKEEVVDYSILDKVILSPGINPNHLIVKKAIENNIEVIGEAEFALNYIKNRCIGITGSNGKTTVCYLISHVLNLNNIKARCVGNIGVSLTSILPIENEKEILIVELSSYQLETLSCKCLDIGIILNISPDHLDRYESYEKYALAKLNIIKCLKDEQMFFSQKKIIKKYSQSFSLINSFPFEGISVVDKLLLSKLFYLGKDNVIAAYLICENFGVDIKSFVSSALLFEKPKHRLEFVKEINDVYFYNDSKATNVESVVFAVESLQKNIILIVGGDDKKLDYSSWQKVFERKVKYILAIGKNANKIKLSISKIKIEIKETLKDAVEKAYKIAEKNDKVLLSPGTSSFDMFKNYIDRGEKYKDLVNLIEMGGKVK